MTQPPSLDTTAAHAALAALRRPHAYGHTCTDNQWYAPHLGTHSPCPVLGHITLLEQQLTWLRASVHDAAHHDLTVETVARALYDGTPGDPEGPSPWDTLHAEARDGFRTMARWGIEALAAVLDPDSRPELQERDWPTTGSGKHRGDERDAR